MENNTLFYQDNSGNFTPPPPPPPPPSGFTPPPPPTPPSGFNPVPPPISPVNAPFNDKKFLVTKMAGDMRIFGLFNIIMGAVNCLGCIGAIFGIPMIFAGIRLRQSADAFLEYVNNNDERHLDTALERQSRYFFIQKVFVIISLVLIIISIVFFIIYFALIMTMFKNIDK